MHGLALSLFSQVYYKEAVGAIIVFDITRLSTFEAVQMWKSGMDSKVLLPNGQPLPAVLLANKVSYRPYLINVGLRSSDRSELCPIKNQLLKLLHMRNKTFDPSMQFCLIISMTHVYIASMCASSSVDQGSCVQKR